MTAKRPVEGERVKCSRTYEAALAPEDRGDTGRVVEIDNQKVAGTQALVAWDSGVSTWIALADLRRES